MLDYREFSLYISLEHENLDKYYFTRGNGEKIIPKDNFEYYTDPQFNTTHDWILAKLIASRRLMNYLQDRLADPVLRPNSISIKDNVQLEWTNSKIALIELIYALHYSNSIDHGKSDISKIAKAFQGFFDFEIGEIYQTFSEIKMRQKSRTKFLDELSFALKAEMRRRE